MNLMYVNCIVTLLLVPIQVEWEIASAFIFWKNTSMWAHTWKIDMYGLSNAILELNTLNVWVLFVHVTTIIYAHMALVPMMW